MARKPKGHKRTAKTKKKSRQPVSRGALPSETLSELGDWRIGPEELLAASSALFPDAAWQLMGEMLRSQMGQPGARSENAAQDRAFELCEQARAAPPAKATKLARQALDAWPDCAEAYGILGQLATSATEAVPLFEQAVAAGRRALEPDWDWLRDEDAFWGYVPTRPFMRALAGLADALWSLGRRDDAIERFLELLTLNPNDNQGIRDVIVPRLIEMRRHEDARRILQQYAECENSFSTYSLALLEFSECGDTNTARDLLKQALQMNPHVPEYLVANLPLPRNLPRSYSWQSPEEAQIYVDEAQRAWRSTPGALAWLRAAWTPIQDELLGEDELLDEVDCEELLQLPLSGETWLLVVVPVPPKSSQDAAGAGLLLTNFATGDVMGTHYFEQPPAPADVWAAFAELLRTPKFGAARRPGKVDVLETELCTALRPYFQQVDINVAVTQDQQLRERYQHGLARLGERSEFSGEVSDLPIAEDEAWLFDGRQLDTWIQDDDGQLVRPWAMLVVGPAGILASHVTMQSPSDEDCWNAVQRAMRNPLVGKPHRPSELLVGCNDRRLQIERFLDGISCAVLDDMPLELDAVFGDLSQTLNGPRPLTPYIQQPGMSIERVGRLFALAATFYRCAPWTFTPCDAAWEIQLVGLTRPWFVVVIGQNGETFGLSMFEEFDDCVRTMSGEVLGPEILNISTITLNFEEAQALTGADLDAADQFGWPIPAPEAHPLIYRTGVGDDIQTPTAQDFQLLEAALQSLPDFIRSAQEFATTNVDVDGIATEVRLARVPPSQLKPKRRRTRR